MISEIKDNKYEVGTQVFSFTDENRNEVLGDATGKRKIAVRIYYPTDKVSAEELEKSAYVSDNKWNCLRKMYYIPKSVKKAEDVSIYENAPMIEERFPLVLFNHGYGSYIEANTYLCMEIASRGYIVASIGHPYESLCTEYEDGTWAPYDKRINKKMYCKGAVRAVFAQLKLSKKKGSTEDLYEGFVQFEKEHTPFIIERLTEWGKDSLAALEQVKIRFENYLDLTKGVAATGHSLGGATAYYLCQHSDLITCGLNIDGALFGDYEGMTLNKPFFQIACRDNWSIESIVLLNRKAPVYWTVFENMKHIGFTDVKFFMKMKMLVGKMDPMKLHNNLTQCHIFFLDKYLKGLDVDDIKIEDDEISFGVETDI